MKDTKLDFAQFDVSYDKRPGALKDYSPQQYAQLANSLTNSEDFEFGNTNIVGRGLKRVSQTMNLLAQMTGLSDVGAEVGSKVGSVIGKEEVGEQAGASVGRGAMNMIPFLTGGGVSAMTKVAALTGAQVLDETNDATRATVAGGVSMLAPAVIGKITPAIGGKVLGQNLATRVGGALTSNTAVGASSRFTGNLVDSFVFDTAADSVDIALADDRSFAELGTSDYWAAQAIGNLAFAPLDAKQAIQAQKVGNTNKLSSALDEAIALADSESVKRQLAEEKKGSTQEVPVQIYLSPERTAASTASQSAASLIGFDPVKTKTNSFLGNPIAPSIAPINFKEGNGSKSLVKVMSKENGRPETIEVPFNHPLKGLDISPKNLADPQFVVQLFRRVGDAVEPTSSRVEAVVNASKAADGDPVRFIRYLDEVIAANETGTSIQKNFAVAGLKNLRNELKSAVTAASIKTEARQSATSLAQEISAKAVKPIETLQDVQERVGRVNAYRVASGLPAVNDVIFASMLKKIDGKPPTDADVDVVVQKLENDVLLDNAKKSDSFEELNKILDNSEDAVIVHPKAVEQLKKSFAKNEGDFEFTDRAISAFGEWRKAKGDLPDLARRINNVQRQIKRLGESKENKKRGRPTKIKDEDLSTVFERVEGLDKDVRDSAINQFSNFMTQVAEFSFSPSIANSGAKVLAQWMTRKDGNITPGKLRGMFSTELKRLKLNAAKENKKHEEFNDNFFKDDSGETATQSHEADYNGLLGEYDWEANNGIHVRAAEVVMMRRGLKPAEAQALAPEVVRIVDAFEALTGQKVEVGKLLNADGSLAGLSSRSMLQNVVFLNPKLKDNHAGFVAAHEILGHQYEKMYKAGLLTPSQTKSYDRAVDYIRSLTPTDRASLLKQFGEEILPKSLHNQLANVFDSTSSSVSEVMSNLAGILAYSTKTKADIGGVAMYLPQRVYDHLVSAGQFLRKAMDAVKSFAGLQKLRGFDIKSVNEIHGFKTDIDNVMGKLDAQATKAQVDFKYMDTLMEGGIGRLWSDLSADATKLDFKDNVANNELADAMFLVPKSIRKFVSENAEGIVKKLSRYKDLINVQTAMRVEKMATHILQRNTEAVMFGESISPDGIVKVGKGLGPVGEVVKSPKLSNIVNDIILYQQINDVNFFTIRKENPEQHAKLLEGLTMKEVAAVEETLARTQKVTKLMQEEMLQTHERVQTTELAILLRDKVEGTQEQVKAVAKLLQDLHKAGDPRLEAELTARGLEPKNLIDFLNTTTAAITKNREMFSQRSYFVTERRMKQFHVSYSEDTKNPSGLRDFDTKEEAQSFVSDLRKRKKKVHFDGNGVRDTYQRFGATNQQFEQFGSLLNAAEDKSTMKVYENMLASKEITQAAYDRLVASRTGLRSALSALNIDKTLSSAGPNRKFRGGRENLNMLEQHLRYTSKLALSLPRYETDATFRYERQNPEIISNERNLEAFNDADRGLANMRTPNTRLGNAIVKGNFLHFLAMNIGSGIVEVTQAPVNLSPKLAEEGSSMLQAYKLPVDAADAIARRNFSGEWKSGKSVRIGGHNVDLYQALINRAEKAGRIGLGAHQETHDAQMETMSDLGLMARGNSPQGKNILSTASGSAMHLVSKFYGMFTGFNEKVGLISGLEHTINKSYKGKKSFTEAEFTDLFNESTRIAGLANNSLGGIDTPVGLFAGNRTFAQSMHSLASFNNGIMSNLYRYATNGINKNLDGLTQKQSNAAKKAAVMSWAGLVSMAGLIGGTALAGPITAMLEEHTDFEVQKNLREFMFDLGKDFGPEAGTFAADVGAHGFAYALGAPMDMSNRVSVGGLLGVNSFEGWSPKALLGPTVSRAEDYGTAAISMLKGDVNKAIEHTLPIGPRKLYNMWQDNGDITDKEGNVILKPTRSEQISQAFGIKPSRITQNQDASRIKQIETRIRQERNREFSEDLYNTLQNQGSGAAQLQLAQYVKDNPGYEPSAAARSVAHIMNNREQGKDPRLTGTLQGAEGTARWMDTFDQDKFPRQSLVTNKLNQVQTNQQLGFQQSAKAVKSDLLQAMLTENLRDTSNLPVPVLSQYAGNLMNPQRQTSQRGRDLLDAFANTSRLP
tara:strand:- start:15324 stop:21623 length:6300 start_codon:yes stop_codon:yes gene_type:complete